MSEEKKELNNNDLEKVSGGKVVSETGGNSGTGNHARNKKVGAANHWKVALQKFFGAKNRNVEGD